MARRLWRARGTAVGRERTSVGVARGVAVGGGRFFASLRLRVREEKRTDTLCTQGDSGPQVYPTPTLRLRGDPSAAGGEGAWAKTVGGPWHGGGRGKILRLAALRLRMTGLGIC